MGLEFRFRKHHVFDGQLEIHVSPHELPKASHIRELLIQLTSQGRKENLFSQKFRILSCIVGTVLAEMKGADGCS